ncbi:hypothetical protein D4764_05G0011440 [Takifugu flavidus]|uniref:Reverse transcriptase domain-containing protein n=1 Tax=Takifugu flavidus TaxID=433684 RepID=A0A5C6N0H1_9TELE|nr:hypothetical protein D4764_05G0011440 [Takifugu flavidus]
MVLNRKKVECLLRVKEEILPQVEEFKYLGVLFMSKEGMEQEIDRWIGVASTVMRTLHRSVVVKRELSRKAKLSIYRLIFVPTLTYGHELWVMTKRTRSRVRAAEMTFLHRVAGLSLRDRVRSSAIREELGVEPLLLRVERSQMRWLGHLLRMPPGRLPGEMFRACPSGSRPPGRPRTHWRDYVSRLAWERLGIPPDELEDVAGEREVWASLLRLLPPRPNPGWNGKRTKSEIQGQESVGESKCPEARRNPSEEGEEEEVRGRGARKVAEEPGETLENAGSRRESLEGAGRRREALGSLERCWVDGKCCQKHQRTKSEIQGQESVGESKCPEARRNPSEEGEEEEVRGRGARKVAEEPGETLEDAGERWESQGVAGRRRETQGGAGGRWGAWRDAGSTGSVAKNISKIKHWPECIGAFYGCRVVWADWVQLKERAQVVVVELIAQEEVGPE